MEVLFKELFNKISNNEDAPIIDLIFQDYALFKKMDNELVLIRSYGIFQDNSMIQSLIDKFDMWEYIFENVFYEFSLEDYEIFILANNQKNLEFCIFFVYHFHLKKLNKEFLYLIFLNEINRIKRLEKQLPIYLRKILYKNIYKKSPLVIVSEIGSYEDFFLKTLIEIKKGNYKNVLLFEVYEIDEKVQMSEFLGVDPGERLKTKNIIPVLEMDFDVFIGKEITYFGMSLQKKLTNIFKEKTSFSNKMWYFTTNYNIEKLVENNKFDPDLWDILKDRIIFLPPVREVKEYLLEEVQSFLDKLTYKYRRKVNLTQEAIKEIMKYDWPGNLEELYRILETAFVICDSEIKPKNLLFGLWEVIEKKDLNLRKNIEDLEKKNILVAYRMLGGNQVHMANVLGISRGSLQYKLQKYGIKIYEE